jgi:hypothetical protein
VSVHYVRKWLAILKLIVRPTAGSMRETDAVHEHPYHNQCEEQDDEV